MEILFLSFLPLAIIYYADTAKKLRRTTRRIKQLEQKEKRNKGENSMSQLIQNLVKTRATIVFDEEIQAGPYVYHILAADEEWMKIQRETKKGTEVRIVRIENIKEIKPESEAIS